MFAEPGCKFSILASNKAVAAQSLRYTDFHALAMIHLGLIVSVCSLYVFRTNKLNEISEINKIS